MQEKGVQRIQRFHRIGTHIRLLLFERPTRSFGQLLEKERNPTARVCGHDTKHNYSFSTLSIIETHTEALI